MLHRQIVRTLAVLLALSVAGCDTVAGPDGPLDTPLIEVLDASTVPGEPVSLRIRNLSGTEWGHNACSSPRLQRLEGDEWVDAPPPLILCTAQLNTLHAGQTLTTSVAVPLGYEVGTYRVRYALLRNDGADAHPTSNSFEIE